MTYIPTSPKERDAMLETIGVKSLDDLFEAVPAKHRFPQVEPAARADRNGSHERAFRSRASQRKCAR